MRKATTVDKSQKAALTADQKAARKASAKRAAVASGTSRTTVVATTTRVIDGVEYIVNRLDNPVGERMSARSATPTQSRVRNHKRDVTRGAGSRKATGQAKGAETLDRDERAMLAAMLKPQG